MENIKVSFWYRLWMMILVFFRHIFKLEVLAVCFSNKINNIVSEKVQSKNPFGLVSIIHQLDCTFSCSTWNFIILDPIISWDCIIWMFWWMMLWATKSSKIDCQIFIFWVFSLTAIKPLHYWLILFPCFPNISHNCFDIINWYHIKWCSRVNKNLFLIVYDRIVSIESRF